MDYKYLRAFLLTAKHQSFSKAAEELRIAQSAVSRQIKLLEEDLDCQLIVRSPKKIVLTEKGNELYLSTADFDKSVSALFSTESMPEIRIGVLHGVLETWGVSFIERYLEKHSANLVILTGRPEPMLDGLAKREFDIAITNYEIQDQMLTSFKLISEKLVLISKNKIDLNKIYDHRWITFEKIDWLPTFFNKKTPKHFVRVNSMTAIINLVKRGVGIAIVPTHMLGENPEGFVVHPLTKVENPSIYVTTLNYALVPKHLKSVLEFFRASARS